MRKSLIKEMLKIIYNVTSSDKKNIRIINKHTFSINKCVYKIRKYPTYIYI